MAKRAKKPNGEKRLSEMEALRFGKQDAELRNIITAIRGCDLELKILEHEYAVGRSKIASNKLRLEQLLAQKRPMYQQLTKKIADRFDVDITKMSIDPDTREVTSQV
jgi:hypothetical protein